jgi:hypothetical protein
VEGELLPHVVRTRIGGRGALLDWDPKSFDDRVLPSSDWPEGDEVQHAYQHGHLAQYREIRAAIQALLVAKAFGADG